MIRFNAKQIKGDQDGRLLGYVRKKTDEIVWVKVSYDDLILPGDWLQAVTATVTLLSDRAESKSILQTTTPTPYTVTASNGSASSVVVTGANHIKSGVEVGDKIYNRTKAVCGKVTSFSATTSLADTINYSVESYSPSTATASSDEVKCHFVIFQINGATLANTSYYMDIIAETNGVGEDLRNQIIINSE